MKRDEGLSAFIFRRLLKSRYFEIDVFHDVIADDTKSLKLSGVRTVSMFYLFNL